MTAPLFWLSASYLRLYDWKYWHGSYDDIRRLTFFVDFGGLFRIGAEIKPDETGLHFYCHGSRVSLGDHPIDFKFSTQPQPEHQLSELFHSGLHDLFSQPKIENYLRDCYADERLPDVAIHCVTPSWGWQSIWIPVSNIHLYGVGQVEDTVYGRIALDRFITIRDLDFYQRHGTILRTPLMPEILSSELRGHIMQALSLQRMLDDLVDGDQELRDYDGIIAGAKPETLIPVHLGNMPPILQPA
ncbi:MAG: hypothetical protein ABIS59_03230 [Candidatus Saccharibacteria bacterium]